MPRLFDLSTQPVDGLFEENWCSRCERDRAVWGKWNQLAGDFQEEPKWSDACQILAKALSCRASDPEYPQQIRYCLDTPCCTGFVRSKADTQ